MQPTIHKFTHLNTDDTPKEHRKEITRAMLHEMAADYIADGFSRKGEVDAMFILGFPGGRAVWVQTKWENDSEKVLTVHMMKSMMHYSGCDCYAQVSEAWKASENEGMSEADKKLVETARTTGGGLWTLPPHLRDDIVFAMSFDRGGTVYHSHWIVNMRRHGPNFLGPRIDEQFAEEHWQGRMSNLLLQECPKNPELEKFIEQFLARHANA